MFGPDVTFLGVERCDIGEPASYADADVVIVGAPFDGGTTNRPGTRFGPAAIRQACYLEHDGSRPSLALRTDGLRDLKVYDAASSSPAPSAATASSKLDSVATGPARRCSAGWRSSACARTR